MRLSQHVNIHIQPGTGLLSATSAPFVTLSADYLKDGSIRYYCVATYSQPIANSSTAAGFSRNIWQKAIALSLFAMKKQQGLEHCGEDTLIPRGTILQTPKNICKKVEGTQRPTTKPTTLGKQQRLMHDELFRLQYACIIPAQSYQVPSYCPLIVRFQLLASSVALLWAVGVGQNHTDGLMAITGYKASQVASQVSCHPASARKQAFFPNASCNFYKFHSN